MTVDDLKQYYGCKSILELSKKIDRPEGIVEKEGGKGISNTTLHKWKRSGIPHRTQAFFQVVSKGKLKVSKS